MHKFKTKKLNIKNNKSGFTYVELVMVIGIIAVLGAVVGGSVASAWNSRASKAINVTDSMLAQSKVDALSGRDNFFVLRYDDAEEIYYCELYKGVLKTTDTSLPAGAILFKSEPIGNKRLKMTCKSSLSPSTTEQLRDGKLAISFDSSTGKVAVSKWFGISAASINYPTATSGGTVTITASSMSDFKVILHVLTGEHAVER